MYAFTLEQPTSLADAKRLTAGGAQALAGGQTMLASMKQRLMQPDHLVDLAKRYGRRTWALTGIDLALPRTASPPSSGRTRPASQR